MGSLILPDWNYPLTRRPKTDAERRTRDHGFTRGTEFVNGAGQGLAELLESEPGVIENGAVYPRWTFPHGSAVVLGQGAGGARFEQRRNGSGLTALGYP
jgi:hypothetical protein